MRITIPMAMKHLIVEDEGETEYIQQCIDASYVAAEEFICLKIVDELSDDDTVAAGQIVEDAQITRAVLMMAGHFYENREDVVITAGSANLKTVPNGFERNLWPKRKVGI